MVLRITTDSCTLPLPPTDACSDTFIEETTAFAAMMRSKIKVKCQDLKDHKLHNKWFDTAKEAALLYQSVEEEKRRVKTDNLRPDELDALHSKIGTNQDDRLPTLHSKIQEMTTALRGK